MHRLDNSIDSLQQEAFNTQQMLPGVGSWSTLVLPAAATPEVVIVLTSCQGSVLWMLPVRQVFRGSILRVLPVLAVFWGVSTAHAASTRSISVANIAILSTRSTGLPRRVLPATGSGPDPKPAGFFGPGFFGPGTRLATRPRGQH